MSIDNSKKSPRLLQSRRYTHDTFTDAQEAFTSVLDINADEVYIDQNLIPSSSLPFGTSGDNLSIYSSGGQQVMKYYYRYKMTKSSTNNEVWFFTTGTTAGIDAQLIDSNQQVNFISPKYSIPSLSTANAEDATPGYGVKVFVSTNSSSPSAGDQISASKFVFDYKTGVLQFVLTSDAPTNSQYVYISAYQYVGRKLSNNIATYATTGSNRFNGSQTITGSLNVTNDLTGSHLNIGNVGTFFTGSRQEAVTIYNSGSYDVIVAEGNSEKWLETYFRNTNSGSEASTDLVIGADNGSDETHYVNLGINSSNYNAGYVGNSNDSYLFSVAHDFYIGTIALTGQTSNLNIFTSNSWQNPQIRINDTKQIGFNTSSVSNGYQYEFSGSALFDHNAKVKGDLFVDGILTANELHVSYTTSSIQYNSGSTKFGNSLDDTHTFSGSILVHTLLETNRISPVDGSDVTIESSNLRVPNGGIFSNFNIESAGRITGQTITGSYITGSFIGDASGLTNVPFHITGSDVDGNQTDKTFTKLHFDSDTGLNVSESALGTAFISIGSHFKDIFVSGSPLLSATGSDAFEIIKEGGIDITTSITDTNTNGYVKEIKFSTLNLSSSLNTRINNITGSLNTFTSSVNTHLTSLDNFTSSVVLTNQTSSMTVLSASYALTAAFALNAGGGSGGGASDGSYVELNQTTPSTTWTFNHKLGQKYPIFQVFDSTDRVIIPSQIIAVDSDNATITFPSAQTGRVIASLGTGPGGMSQYFSSAATWSLNHNMGTEYPIVTVYSSTKKIIYPQEIKSIDGNNVDVYFSTPVAGYLNVSKGGHIISGSIDMNNINLTGSNILSSSAQITNYGYAITGSNTFTGNQVINGTLTLNKAKMGSTCVTLTTGSDQVIFDLSGFDGANFDYVIKNGSNMRGGLIMSVWDNYNSSYNETSTTDLGNTSDVTFSVSNDGKLKTSIASGTWNIEVMYRALKCS